MTTALEIATYIHNTWHRFSGEMQMHKLLYYAQAWSLAWDGQPLFDDPIEAWDKGPVVRSLRYETLPSEPVPSLSESQQATIEAVLDYYGKRGGAKLSQQTHEESPWQQARDRHSGNNRCTEEITHDSMRRAYTQQSLAGQGPRRRAVTSQRIDQGQLLERSAQARQEWRPALALLAQ